VGDESPPTLTKIDLTFHNNLDTIKATERKYKMTMDELMEYILREIPEAVFGEDAETGEVVIATGLVLTKADELKELTK
jgi:pantothenate kinase